ncbi:double zinc ribbon domain-containing protein [Methanobrevibacter sp.]|uniref:double zinc ribbon domain-containing protein n=1 Tax=Methanobrevibacter sp. TaxID=66852 RepID=UPI00386E46D7
MVECPKCGNEVEDSNFCDKCGEKIEKAKTCPNCDFELGEESVFCPNCGTKVKDDSSEEETEKEEPQEEVAEEKEATTKEETEKEEKKEIVANCPYCNTGIDEPDIDFCPECGKPIKVDKQSFEGIKLTIQPKKILIFSILAIICSSILALLLSFIFGMVTTVDLYPLGFLISLLIVVGIFGSFKDLINGGLLGIITGFVLGLLSTLIVEFSCGYAFSYQMFSGYSAIVLTIFGAIVGVISTKYLRKHILKYLDVENTFN